jgi:hypothetical protein
VDTCLRLGPRAESVRPRPQQRTPGFIELHREVRAAGLAGSAPVCGGRDSLHASPDDLRYFAAAPFSALECPRRTATTLADVFADEG